MSGRVPRRLLGVGAVAVVCGVVAGCSGSEARKAAHMERGRRYLAAQNYDKASVEFRNALQIDPKDPQANYEEGVVREKLGRLKEAVGSYQEALTLAPKQDYLDAAVALARLMVAHGAAEQALPVIKAALQSHPDEPQLLMLRAVARAQQKDLAGAQADAERAVGLAPRNADAIAALAGIYQSEGESAKSQALIERAVQDIPGSVDFHFVLAQIYAGEGRVADAEAQYLKVVELRPNEGSQRIRLAQFYSRVNRPDAAEATLRRAVTDLPADRAVKLSLLEFLDAHAGHGAAEDELKKMIAAAPKDYDLQFSLAALYRQTGANPQAEAVYRGVIAQERTNPPGLRARDLLAGLRLQQNDPEGALALAREVLAENPRDNDALVVRARVELVRNDPRSAIVDLREVQHDQPNDPEVAQLLASAHLANKEPQIAADTLRQAVAANPGNVVLATDLAQLLMRLGKPDQAAAVTAAAVKQAPGNIDALDAQFRVAMMTRDLDRAQAAADAMVAQQPKLVLGYMHQGAVAEAQQRVDDALRLYTAAADLQPDAIEPLEAMVRELAATHHLPEAQQHLNAVAARYPRDPRPYYLEGELLLRNGRLAQAKDAFGQAIARAPKWWPPYRGTADAQLLGKEDLATIIDGLRRAKATVSRTDQVSAALASLLVRAGKPDAAVTEYEDGLRRNPQSDPIANNLAMLLVTYRTDRASLDRARDLAARFVSSPSTDYRDTYGWVLYKRGEAAAAVPVFASIAAESPESAVARYHLGMAQALAGDVTAARENLARAVDSGQRFTGRDDARSELERLGGPASGTSPRT